MRSELGKWAKWQVHWDEANAGSHLFDEAKDPEGSGILLGALVVAPPSVEFHADHLLDKVSVASNIGEGEQIHGRGEVLLAICLFPSACRKPRRLLLLGSEALFDFCFRTLKLTNCECDSG